jgi:protoporphyrinogen IX oxidase
MWYTYIKALHIIFVVTWFAGLFYMPRLMVYAAEAAQQDEIEKNILLKYLLLWQKRLWYGITTPSAMLTLLFGGSLLSYYIQAVPTWLWVKLGFLVGLYTYHYATHLIFNQQQNRIFNYTSNQLRLWNEIPTLFLFAIIFQVTLKEQFSYSGLLLTLAILIGLIYTGFAIYKRFRKKQTV